MTDEILNRPKRPCRAPHALSFIGADRPEWVDELMSAKALERAGLFDLKVVNALWQKCLTRSDDGQFSNSDTMAVVGVLSAQLLHQQLVEAAPSVKTPTLKTLPEAIFTGIRQRRAGPGRRAISLRRTRPLASNALS